MRNLLLVRVAGERRGLPSEHRLLRRDPFDIDPPAPLQIFTRLCVLLVVALAFGLAAELLAQLPPQ